jgi:hypothetical protein
MDNILKKKTVLRDISLHEFKRDGNATEAARTMTEVWGESVISER